MLHCSMYGLWHTTAHAVRQAIRRDTIRMSRPFSKCEPSSLNQVYTIVCVCKRLFSMHTITPVAASDTRSCFYHPLNALLRYPGLNNDVDAHTTGGTGRLERNYQKGVPQRFCHDALAMTHSGLPSSAALHQMTHRVSYVVFFNHELQPSGLNCHSLLATSFDQVTLHVNCHGNH